MKAWRGSSRFPTPVGIATFLILALLSRANIVATSLVTKCLSIAKGLATLSCATRTSFQLKGFSLHSPNSLHSEDVAIFHMFLFFASSSESLQGLRGLVPTLWRPNWSASFKCNKGLSRLLRPDSRSQIAQGHGLLSLLMWRQTNPNNFMDKSKSHRKDFRV